jgi:CRP-like cAMP-binding protein
MSINTDICARNHGNNTESAAAFERNHSTRKFDREQLFDLLQQSPMTMKEVSSLLQRPLHTLSGRASELKQQHRVEKTGLVRDGSAELRAI